MGILKKIDSARMKIMRRVTGGIGDSNITIKSAPVLKLKKY